MPDRYPPIRPRSDRPARQSPRGARENVMSLSEPMPDHGVIYPALLRKVVMCRGRTHRHSAAPYSALLVVAILALAAPGDEPPAAPLVPLRHAHAHNDYEHK